MSTSDHPPTLVDLAALLREASFFGSALYRQRTQYVADAIDAHLADLRALAERMEDFGCPSNCLGCETCAERRRIHGYARSLRALLGQAGL